MRARGGGSIVNIGSINAYIGEPKLWPVLGVEGRADDADEERRGVPEPVPHPRQPAERRLDADRRASSGSSCAEGKGEDWLEEAVATRPFGRLLEPQRHRLCRRLLRSDESALITGSVLDLEQYPVGAPPTGSRALRLPCIRLQPLNGAAHLRLPQVLLRRPRRRPPRLPRLDPRGGVARRRRRRALRRVLPEPRRRRTSIRSSTRCARPARSRRCSASRRTSPTPTPTSGRGRSSGRRRPSTCRCASATRYCRTLSGQRYPGTEPRRGDRAAPSRASALARVRRAARRRAVPGEPLQGRQLAVSRVRPAGGRLPRGHRADRLAAFRRAVRPVERRRRRLRPDRVPREGEAPRGDDARLRPVPRAGRHDRGDPRRGRHGRLFRQAAARRDRARA